MHRTDTVTLHPHSHTLHRTEQSHYNHSHTLHRTDTVTLHPHSHTLHITDTVTLQPHSHSHITTTQSYIT